MTRIATPRRLAAYLGLTVALVTPAAVVQAQSASVATVKAAFLYNFVKFTEWPAATLGPGQVLVLCVAGDTAVADALEATIKGRVVQGHQLAVQVLGRADAPNGCHLIYVDSRDQLHAAQATTASAMSRGTFSVGDGDRFAERGGIAQLILESDRMRFAINVNAVERAGLRLSSKLLGLAEIIREPRHAQP